MQKKKGSAYGEHITAMPRKVRHGNSQTANTNAITPNDITITNNRMRKNKTQQIHRVRI